MSNARRAEGGGAIGGAFGRPAVHASIVSSSRSAVQGFLLPGTTIVCGSYHKEAHSGIGALAFVIGMREVEHVLMPQTLFLKQSK